MTTDIYRYGEGQVAWEAAGDGPAVLLVHAPELGGGRDEWLPLARELVSAGFRTCLLDLPGFGASSAEPRRYDADLMIDVLRGFVREVVRTPCHLVARGHAAAYAAVLAGEAPERHPKLVVVNPYGIHAVEPRPEVWAWFTESGLGRRRYEELVTPASLRAWLEHEAYYDRALVTDDLVAATAARALRPVAEYPAAALLGGYLARDVRREWVAVPQPVLLLWGEACEDPPLDDAESWLLPLRPDAPFLMIDRTPVGIHKQTVLYKAIPKTRQRPHLEAPEHVGQLVADWLRDA